jgi:signal peptidase I
MDRTATVTKKQEEVNNLAVNPGHQSNPSILQEPDKNHISITAIQLIEVNRQLLEHYCSVWQQPDAGGSTDNGQERKNVTVQEPIQVRTDNREIYSGLVQSHEPELETKPEQTHEPENDPVLTPTNGPEIDPGLKRMLDMENDAGPEQASEPEVDPGLKRMLEMENDPGPEQASETEVDLRQLIVQARERMLIEPEAEKEKARKNKRKKPSLLSDILFLMMKITLISLAFALLFTFLFGLIRYQEPTMAPAVKDGDLVIFHRYPSNGYQVRDAVVLEYNGQRIVRRVVATAGDIVDVTEDGLLINGAPQQEPDIYQKTERYQEGVEFPLTVPDGQVFVLADARAGATDSRIYNCIKIEDTLGKVMAVIRRRSI